MDAQGESPRIYSPSSELGFFYNDTRYLSVWETLINGAASVPLARELRFGGSTLVFSMTNRDLERLDGQGRIPRDTLLIRRVLTLEEDSLFETLEIKNFSGREHELRIELWAGGRFDDLFEVRGFPRAKRGRLLAPEDSRQGDRQVTVLQYEGLDLRVRRAFIQRFFEVERVSLGPELAGHAARVRIPAGQVASLRSVVSFDRPSDCLFKGAFYGRLALSEKMELLNQQAPSSHLSGMRFYCDNAILERSIRNAQTDILMLLTAESSGELYPYAGIPWYSAPFGRDGIIAAYQLLPWHPGVAKGVLDYVFALLGRQVDSFTDEQPGKVFHELRRGEMARTREVPFIPYYGSVDATPLALILLHEYVRWTGDKAQLRAWWPDALRCLEWIEKWGDADGDGFVEYSKQSPSGLVNQGWKDSHDSVMHADGRLACAPIRLCEVQAYAFRARLGLSQLARELGDEALAHRLRADALRLRSLFIERFWDPARSYVYLALDGQSRPCEVISSNMGHCLWGQILPPEQARAVASHLASDAMFSGFGVRTLADTERAYNPLSYHNGSVWPHDNSLIMEGLRYYGLGRELGVVAAGLLEVLESSDDFRLPELFCGFRRRPGTPPVPYEVACKPQAWSAGSLFLLLKSVLGLSMETGGGAPCLVLNAPMLPAPAHSLELRGLRGKDWELDLRFRRSDDRTAVEVLRRSGGVRVLTVR